MISVSIRYLLASIKRSPRLNLIPAFSGFEYVVARQFSVHR